MSDRQEIKSDLEVRIIKGEFPEYGQMLSVTAMAREYNISTTTAMQIYNEMKQEGTLLAKPGTYTLVNENCKSKLLKKHKERFSSELYKLSKYAEDLGLDIGEELEKILRF